MALRFPSQVFSVPGCIRITGNSAPKCYIELFLHVSGSSAVHLKTFTNTMMANDLKGDTLVETRSVSDFSRKPTPTVGRSPDEATKACVSEALPGCRKDRFERSSDDTAPRTSDHDSAFDAIDRRAV